MKTLRDYTIVLRPESNGTFVAYIPAIAGCHAWGQTSDEAQHELENVFDMIQAEYQAGGRSVPLDVEVVIANAS